MTEEQKLQDLADKHEAKKKAEIQTKSQKAVERRRSLEDRELARELGLELGDLA